MTPKSINQEVLATLNDQQAASLKILLDRGIKIPPQPRVAELFGSAVRRGVKDVRELARILSEDPGITALLFKIVRTPAYQQYQPFESVEEILQAVGLKPAAHLVQAIAFGVSMPSRNASAAFEAYWSRSRAIAQLAMLVAEFRFDQTGLDADQAYLAGIFHDCGIPVLMQRFPTYGETMSLNVPGCWADIALEDKKYFADHAVVGYLVGRHWFLPDYVCAAIRHHHDLDGTKPPEARVLVAAVQYAVELYYRTQSSDNPDWEAQCAGIYHELRFTNRDEDDVCADSVLVAFDALS
jgi:HD-like signal output (HDOD) protein